MPGDVSMLDLTDLRWRGFAARHPDATPFHHPDRARLAAAAESPALVVRFIRAPTVTRVPASCGGCQACSASLALR